MVGERVVGGMKIKAMGKVNLTYFYDQHNQTTFFYMRLASLQEVVSVRPCPCLGRHVHTIRPFSERPPLVASYGCAKRIRPR